MVLPVPWHLSGPSGASTWALRDLSWTSEAAEVSSSIPRAGMDGVWAGSQQGWLWPTRFLGHRSMRGAVLPPDPNWPWKVSSGVWRSCASANKPERTWAGSVSLAERICSLGKTRISFSFPFSVELGRAGEPQPQSPNCSWMQQQCDHSPCPRGRHFPGHELGRGHGHLLWVSTKILAFLTLQM